MSLCVVGVPWRLLEATLPNDRYWERMDAAGIVGKTPAQIAALVGPPDPRTTSWDGVTTEVFDGPFGARFEVKVRNGVAIATDHRTRP